MQLKTLATQPTTSTEPQHRHRSRSGRLARTARWRLGAATLTAVGLGLSMAALAASPASAASHTAAAKATMAEVEIKTVAKYGKILVDQKGLPLYYDAANKAGHWACTGSCLTAWPPLVLAKGQTSAMGMGVKGLGTVKAPYGTQVTWDGKALYTFIQDSPGSVTGNDVHDFFVAKVAKAKGASGAGMTTTTVHSSGGGY
jgi:predicted lipoprotein with Yx(FWY)xxD motif